MVGTPRTPSGIGPCASYILECAGTPAFCKSHLGAYTSPQGGITFFPQEVQSKAILPAQITKPSAIIRTAHPEDTRTTTATTTIRDVTPPPHDHHQHHYNEDRPLRRPKPPGPPHHYRLCYALTRLATNRARDCIGKTIFRNVRGTVVRAPILEGEALATDCGFNVGLMELEPRMCSAAGAAEHLEFT